MSNSYIKCICTKSGIQKTPENIGQLISGASLETDIPVANPDFESIIGEVRSWLIEFEADSYYPNREIGLNELNEPIMIMPWKKNYGYWTDNNLVIEDFRHHFLTVDISKSEFEKYWNLFEKNN